MTPKKTKDEQMDELGQDILNGISIDDLDAKIDAMLAEEDALLSGDDEDV